MKSMKNTLVMLVSVVTVAALALGGTLAYVTTAPQNKANVFTVGSVDIDLKEEVGVLGEGGTVKSDEDGAEYEGVMPGDYLKKKVTVTNTGKTPAYVAVSVTLNNADKINAAIDDVYEKAPYNYTAEQVQAMYDYIFDGWGINYNPRPGATGANNARGVIDGTYGVPEHVLKVDFSKTTDFDNDTTMFSTDNWFQNEAEQNATKAGKYSAWLPGGGYYTSKLTDDPATAEDERDYMIVYTYYLYLPAGESSTLFKGLNVPAEFNADQLAMFDGLEIDVEAKAIQADNMAIANQYKGDENGKAKTAFAILAGDIETPEYSNKPSGTVTPGHTSATTIWGEAKTNAKQSVVIKFYSGDTYMGETSLNDKDDIIDGTIKNVTWNIALNGQSTDYWSMSWEKAPSINLQPTKVELWVDGDKTAENKVKLNNSGDDLAPVTGMVTDSKGTIIKYLFKNEVPTLQDGETYVAFVSSSAELSAALADGGNVVMTKDIDAGGQVFVVDGGTLDGNGKTLIVDSGDAAYESGLTVAEGTAKNVTVTGAFRGLGVGGSGASEMTGDVTYENVTVIGATYGINIGVGNGYKLTVTDSTICNWNSYSGLSGAEFIGCTFTSQSGTWYAAQRVSANATFTYTDCNFEQNKHDNADGTDNYYLDSYGNGTIVLENCYMDGVLITEENVNTLFQIAGVKVIVENN